MGEKYKYGIGDKVMVDFGPEKLEAVVVAHDLDSGSYLVRNEQYGTHNGDGYKIDAPRPTDGKNQWIHEARIDLIRSAKPAPKAKWAPIDLFAGMPRIAIGSPWHIALSEAERKINQLGAENAKLKNQLAKLKGSK